MKKTLLLVLISLVVLLSSCMSDEGIDDIDPMGPMDPTQPITEISFTYDFGRGSFNPVHRNHMLYSLRDYQEEFYKMYEQAKSLGYTSYELTDNEIESFDMLFNKLNELGQYEMSLFSFEASYLVELFEQKSIDVTAFDVFTFNRIKELFQEISYKEISISQTVFISIFTESENEINGVSQLIDFQTEIYLEPFMDYEFDELITLIETVNDIQIDEALKSDMLLGYTLIQQKTEE